MAMALSSAGSITSVTNSSTVALSGGATFTGVAETNGLADMLVACLTDRDGTLYVDLGPGGTNWDSTFTFQVTGGVNEIHRIVKGPRFVRVRYTNGSVAQSYMRLTSYYGSFPVLNSPLKNPVAQDADATTVRAVTEETGIAGGLFTGYSIVNKFGTNSDIDTGTVPEDIWEVGGTYTGFPDGSPETIQVFSDSANDAAAGTGARTVTLIGLNGDWSVLSETVTLNGVTPVATVGQFRRVHTAQVVTAGSGGVNAGTITFRHSTTTANVFLSIVPGRNQSNCSAYTVPAGFTAYMRRMQGNIRGNTTAAVDGYIWTRSFGGVFRSRRPFTMTNTTPLKDDIYGGLVFTEKADIVLRINLATANNTPVSGGYDLLLVKN